MIREAQRSELPAILELWLESTTWGHPFIKANYWRDCIPLVRDAYLANAQNWVWEEDGKLLGFVSIMEGRFLAAMFVAPKAVRRGIGTARTRGPTRTRTAMATPSRRSCSTA